MVFDILHQEIKRWGAARILLRRHPISIGVLNGDGLPIGQVEALSAGYFCQVQNTIVADLSLPVEDLNRGMTREQRKHLYQSERRGLEIREFHGDCKDMSEMHRLYQHAHMRSASGLTRPQKSFDYMLDSARNGHATLFVAFMKESPVSFLYCGEFASFAFGWSQVNLDEYEKENPPRHLLEWTAILSYKRRNFKFYEIGTRWYGPQLYKIPSAKELSIAFFKERYGGQLWPDMVFERFLDQDLFCTQYDLLVQEFLKSGYFEA
ncbi:MAG: GNAT family N-acetyltransferase [Chloroflexi bacterium]|nr:GNAT family N-acetyltransferase [Chloroflexota bacterium]